MQFGGQKLRARYIEIFDAATRVGDRNHYWAPSVFSAPNAPSIFSIMTPGFLRLVSENRLSAGVPVAVTAGGAVARAVLAI